MKNANIDAAVNLEVKDGKATVGFYSTQARPAATVTLKLKDQVLMKETIAISPGHSFVKQVRLPDGRGRTRPARSDQCGRARAGCLLADQAGEGDDAFAGGGTAAAAEIKTTEELYLTGLRMEQFHARRTRDPNAYWQEALRRDPGDIRVNTVLGIDAIKGGPICRCGEASAQGAGARHRKLYLAQGRRADLLPRVGAEVAGQAGRGLHAALQIDVERGMAVAGILCAGGD